MTLAVRRVLAVLGVIAVLVLPAGCRTDAGPPSAGSPSAAGKAAPSGTAPGGAGGTAGPAAVPAPAAPVNPVPASRRPVSISIPSIGVRSSLETLGVTARGTLQVPRRWQRAGWFAGSAVPGARGPAVIAGHVDSRGGPAVFFRLADLRPGAQVVVTSAGGARTRFTVTKVERYAKTSFPTEAVYGPVPGPALRLITCGGQFDGRTGHYRDNVVAFAS